MMLDRRPVRRCVILLDLAAGGIRRIRAGCSLSAKRGGSSAGG
jgi:hypothetical protein